MPAHSATGRAPEPELEPQRTVGFDQMRGPVHRIGWRCQGLNAERVWALVIDDPVRVIGAQFEPQGAGPFDNRLAR